MKSEKIMLSVVIPVYNTEKYLEDCLLSVLSQTYKNIEIVIIDDGSTDNSGKICDEFKKQYKNIQVIHKENGGAADARNRGISASNGEYIHFLDSDDLLIKENIYEDFADIVNQYSPDIIFSRCKTFSADFSEIIKDQPPYEKDGLLSGNILFEVLNKGYEMTLTSPANKLFRREFLTDNRLFFTSGIDHEEDEWLPRVICNARRAYFYNTMFYGVRYLRPNSLSETISEETKARKACSKITIASLGIKYMKSKSLDKKTMSLTINYYWDYLIDACVVYWQITNKQLKQNIIACLKKNSSFFNSYKYLSSKNRRILGMVFKHLGIKSALYFIKIRY